MYKEAKAQTKTIKILKSPLESIVDVRFNKFTQDS